MRLLIALCLIAIVQAIDIYTDDDFHIEDEPYDTNDLIDTESSRDGRMLPYPLQRENEETMRVARFAHYSYPQSPIVDMMLQTVAVNYSPANSNDPFDFLRDSYPLPKGYSKPLDEYDYIIVGASSAGSVLAARLSEDKPKATVLLLEAGKPEMILSDIPALTHHMQDTDYVWRYSMEHQAGVCLGSEEQRCYSPRGKALGGSSVTDYMFYSRGRPEDWNGIAADGNYGWSYNEVLEYFKKSERSELKKYKNLPYRGRDGELTVENVPFKTGLVEAFLAAGRLNGYQTVDYVSPDQLGFGYIQTITNKGHRLSAAKAFLHQHKRRKNMHILTDARVTKILIEPHSKRAFAVDYIKNNVKTTVRCRREIILSAGPIASPQLLMLSGVGPEEHLQTLGIPVLSNVPVGRTLYDHIGFPGVVFKLNSSNASLIEPKVATIPNLMQWLQFGDGLLTTPGGVEGVGYIKTSVSDNPELVPDIELINMGGSITSDGGAAIRKSWKISDRTYHNSFGTLTDCDTWQAIPVLLHPKSRGRLELRDISPFSYPKIFGNFLSDARDIAALKEAIKVLIGLGESEPFRKYGPSLHLAPYPTCSSYAPGSDPYWDCAIRTMVVSMRRQTSTCKMGPENDSEAVVDPELRVRGVQGLRVADISILPKTISGHTIAPEIMIGEKAADLLRKTWSNLIA
ncbi:glucose dehydrogenase [FAD, quinone]-like [Pieris napi]|uniref:glucose dehydrogenase [FAD, quinone]-like n=1 Tax=Pieris napi TaxID=78633 RepID=UPI001FBB5CC0|nr:glucose dehydrogenase [FAD, quinone]-like [Pieris napi]